MTSVAVLEFASAGDVVEMGDLPTGGLGAITVEGWFRAREVGGGNRPLLAKYGDGGHEWAFYLTSDARAYFVVYHAGKVSVGYSAPGSVPLGPWTHLAGCYNGVPDGTQHCKVWIDGADRTMGNRPAAGAPVIVNTGQPVQLGGVFDQGAYPFVGRGGWQRVSSVCRYPGVLRMPDAPPAVDGNTVGQWNVSEGAGVTLDNATGNAAFDGLIAGAVWRESVVDDKRLAAPALAKVFAPVWSRGASAGGFGG